MSDQHIQDPAKEAQKRIEESKNKILYLPHILENLASQLQKAEGHILDIRVSMLHDPLPGDESKVSYSDCERLDEARRLLMLARDHVENCGLLQLKRDGYTRKHPDKLP